MPDIPFSSAAILGTGSFGTALARLLAPKLDRVEMIGRDEAVAASINSTRHNSRYLAGIDLPENIRATTELGVAADHPLGQGQASVGAKHQASRAERIGLRGRGHRTGNGSVRR